MSHTSTTITKPVSAVADVQAVLGLSSTSTTGKESYLCGNTHGQTNKWAKYKPIVMADFPTRTGTYWKGTQGNCGLNFIKRTKMNDIISDYNGGSNWDYVPPTGGSGRAYRIGDFDGYDHNAQCFVNGMTYPLSYAKGSGTGITITMETRYVGSASLSLADLGLDAKYFGVIVVGNGVTRLIEGTSQIPSGNQVSVLIPDSTLTANITYKIYPIAITGYDVRYTGSGITNQNTPTFSGLYTLPVQPASVKITETVETSLNFKGGATTVVYRSTGYTCNFTLQLILTTGFKMENLTLQVEQSNEQTTGYRTIGSVTLNPSTMTGSGSTIKEQAYSGVVVSSSNPLINQNYVRLTVTGINAERTYTAVLIKQMRSNQEIPIIEL